MDYKKIVLSLAFLAVLSFLFVNAGTVKAIDNSALIQQLMAQIAALQAQLTQLQAQQGATQAWCHTFNTNLRYGDQGSEVSALVTVLYKEGLYNETISTINDNVASAIVAFQEKYAADILTRYGLTHGTGYVGPRTRAKLNALYGCTITTQPTIKINYLQPNSGVVGGSVTIMGNGFTPTGNKIKFGSLGIENNPSYSLNSSDGNTIIFTVPSSNYLACWANGCMAPAYLTQPGNYMVSVINSNGTSNEISFAVISSTACIPHWQCGWGSCNNGYQSMTTIDSNNCGVTNQGSPSIACPTLVRACM